MRNSRFESLKRTFLWTALIVGCTFGGCVCKPYNQPIYEVIGPHETAFVIPLEGETGKQAKFQSVEFLETKKVAAKRIQIPRRWKQTGHWHTSGEYMPDVLLIKVDRAPVTREWTAEKETGTKAKDQGIWVESSDSVGFSTGFSVTAMILEENAATFLYRYPNRSLNEVMDAEIRARVQTIFAEMAAMDDMSLLRAKKNEIIKAVREDVIPFFVERGITVTTIGMFGGFRYENDKIQESIDGVFISQREKEVAAALLAAQDDKNKVIELEATARANAAKEVGRGEAEAKRLILAVAKEAADDPIFLEMRRLEVLDKIAEKWDGRYPTYMMQLGNGGQGPAILLNMPVGAPPEK